jgi:DHA3 family macrolide efflux protein-like MFS transporter
MATQFSVSDNIPWKGRFFTIWGVQALSLLGSELVQFALVWYLTIQTGSATVLATATLVAMLPQVLLGPLMGSYVDRWNRRVIMIVADAFIALVTVGLAVLFFLDAVQVWHIYVLMLLRSTAGGMHRTAMGSSTSLMVPVENLTRVQGMNQFLNGGLSIISAPLAALLLELLPMQAILAIDVVTAAVAIMPLFFFAIPQPTRDPDNKKSVWQEMGEGVKYVRGWPGMLWIMLMASMINFFLNPAATLMPLLVNQHFELGALEYGWLQMAFGLGVLGGSLLLGVWGGFKRRIITSMIGLLGIGTGMFLLGAAPVNLYWLALGGAVLTGLTMPMTNGGLGAIMQANVAPEMQGRVFSLLGTGASLMSPLGLALIGPLADVFGVRFPYFLGGGVTVLMGIIGLLSPVIMNIETDGERQRAAHASEAAPVSPAAE